MRYLLAFCLLAVGYLIGTLELPVKAQSSGYYYGSGADGSPTFGTIYTPQPGGNSYFYGSDGSTGLIPAPPSVMDFSMPKSPC